MSLLSRTIKFVWDDINTPETFHKGEDFESYVRQHLFPKDQYTALQRTHNYAVNKDDFIENTKEPDYKFKSPNGVTFFVEAKYRSSYFKGAVEWCKYYQLKRYRAIDKQTPIYVIIGVGQQPNNPAEIFCIPLKDIKYTKLFQLFLRSYAVPTKKHIREKQLI